MSASFTYMTCKCGQYMEIKLERRPGHHFDIQYVFCPLKHFWNFWKHSKSDYFLVMGPN